MNKATIFIRTDKGERMAASTSRELANDLRKVLDAIDGTSSVDALQGKLNFRDAAWLDRALAALVAKELIGEAENSVGALDFTSPAPTAGARHEAEQSARQEAEAKAKHEAEQKARQEAEAKAKHEAEQKARQEAEAKAKHEAEHKARQEAEAKAKHEAEAKAKHEAEHKARQEAEAKARHEAEQKVRQEAEAKAKHAAEQKARQEAEAKAKQEAEAKARHEADEKARREAEERARQEAEAQTRKRSEEQELKLAAERVHLKAAERAQQEDKEQARKLAEEELRLAAERVRRRAAEHARQEAEERARQEAEEQERRKAEERARQEAEEQARKLAEEQARKLAEETARKLAEEHELRKAAELARQEAEEQARKLAADLARRDAEEKARREAEEKARREADEKARREAEAQIRREAEERARREAEQNVKREAEEKARSEAEAKVRQEAEEAARREAAERVRQEAEAKAQREAEEKDRLEAEEKARREAAKDSPREGGEEVRGEAERAPAEAEKQTHMTEEEKAWREAEETFRREEEAAQAKRHKRAAVKEARAGSDRLPNWTKPAALAAAALLVLVPVILHLVSFDGQIPQFEKLLAGQFQQPVKIQALHLSMVPEPHLRLDGVSIGSEGQIKIVQIKAIGALGNLFNDKKVFKAVELDSPVVTEEGLSWILFGKPSAAGMAFGGPVTVLNANLQSKNVSLPAFEAKLQSGGDGTWQSISIESVDKNITVDLTPKGQSVQIDFKARSFRIPFGSNLTLEDLVASGTADSTGLSVTEFKGFAYGGILSGNARLKWGPQWNLSGKLNAKQVDTSRLFPGVVDGGRLVGAAAYAMQAPEAAGLFATNRLEGEFLVARGSLLGVDLGRMLQGGGMSGTTQFGELAGDFVHDRGATQLRQVRLTEATMSANGAVDVDANSNVRGRFSVDLKMSGGQRLASIVVAGTLKKIEWRRQ